MSARNWTEKSDRDVSRRKFLSADLGPICRQHENVSAYVFMSKHGDRNCRRPTCRGESAGVNGALITPIPVSKVIALLAVWLVCTDRFTNIRGPGPLLLFSVIFAVYRCPFIRVSLQIGRTGKAYFVTSLVLTPSTFVNNNNNSNISKVSRLWISYYTPPLG